MRPALIASSSALIAPSTALFVPLPVNRFCNKLAPKVLNNIPRNPPFCSFASFLPSINKPDSSRDLIIFVKHSFLPLKLLMSYYRIQTFSDEDLHLLVMLLLLILMGLKDF